MVKLFILLDCFTDGFLFIKWLFEPYGDHTLMKLLQVDKWTVRARKDFLT
jgi:hypothetical protein